MRGTLDEIYTDESDGNLAESLWFFKQSDGVIVEEQNERFWKESNGDFVGEEKDEMLAEDNMEILWRN